MSPLFIRTMQKKFKCHQCKHQSAKNRKFCLKHLAVARQHWQTWCQKRRRQQQCCYCDRPSVFGWLRCKRHALENRAKCREWVRTHRAERKVYEQNRRNQLLGRGTCPTCAIRPVRSGRRPDGKPYTRCLDCNLRTRASAAGLLKGPVTDAQIRRGAC